MHPSQYFSTLNVGQDLKKCKRQRPTRYKRTNSLDESYFANSSTIPSLYGQTYHHHPFYGGAHILPTVYSSGLLYGAGSPFAFENCQTLFNNHIYNPNCPKTDDLFTNSPANNANNSRWYKGAECITTMPRHPNRYYGNNSNKNSIVQQQRQEFNYDSDLGSRSKTLPGKSCKSKNISPTFGNGASNKNGNGFLPKSDTVAFEPQPSPYNQSMDSTERTPPIRFRNTTRRNRIKLTVICLVCVIIVAILIAFGVAVYSQAKSQNTGLKLVRQYRGYFLVVGGRLLDFDTDLLNTETVAFKNKAKMFQSKIDAIFQESGLVGIYEGSQVTSFQFVVAIPALEVHFNVRTKINVQFTVQDLLSIFEDAIRKNNGGIFSDVALDLSSLNIENQYLDLRKRPIPATQKSLTLLQP